MIRFLTRLRLVGNTLFFYTCIEKVAILTTVIPIPPLQFYLIFARFIEHVPKGQSPTFIQIVRYIVVVN